MPVAMDHSGNFPHEYRECPNCHKKGFYRYGGTVMTNAAGLLDGLVPGQRCKYCKHRVEDMPQEEYSAYLNRTVAPLVQHPVIPDGVAFAEDKERNGAFKSLTVTERVEGRESAITLDRVKLVELYRMLWIDPSLARDAEIAARTMRRSP